MKKIIRNAVTCNNCGDMLRSKELYDYRVCSCRSVKISGGFNRLDRFSPEANYTEQSLFWEIKEDKKSS